MTSINNQTHPVSSALEIAKQSPFFPQASLKFAIFSLSVFGNHLILRDFFKARANFMKRPFVNFGALFVGLFWPYFISRECLGLRKCWKIEKNIHEMQEKKIALIFQAESVGRVFYAQSLIKRAYLLENLEKAGYQPVFKRISSLREIVETIQIIKSHNNNIHVLWLNVHGNADAFDISTKEKIAAYPMDKRQMD